MVPWVADHRHLALVGIAASAMVPDARAIAATYPSVGQGTIFELPGHGFSGALALAGAERVRIVGPNVNGVVLDTAISPTTYYVVGVVPDDPDFLTLSMPLGAPLLLNGDGVGFPSAIENIIPKIDLIMRQWTSKVIANAKAYKAPWYVAPDWAPLLIAQLAAPSVCSILRVASARFDVADIQVNAAAALAQYNDLAQGVPFDDGIGPIDADDVPNDAALATNGIAQGLVCDMRWLSGAL